MKVDPSLVKDEEVDVGMLVPEGGVKPADELDEEEVGKMDLKSMRGVEGVAKLMGRKSTTEVLLVIEEFKAKDPSDSDLGSEDSVEYKLIVQANNLAVEIDNEIILVHKFTRDHYSPRFSGLASLVTHPLEYSRTILLLGNTPDITANATREQLAPIIASQPAVAMVVPMQVSTTVCPQLGEPAWQTVVKACEMMESLYGAKTTILEYVESRLQYLAPNLSAILGPRIATKLLGVAGGLHGLQKMPACNVHLLGAQRKLAAGFSAIHLKRHTGFIYQSPVVQGAPEELRQKVQRTVGAKCVLAVRMDAQGMYKDGSYGYKLLEDIESKIEKLAAPPPTKIIKALPVPAEGKKARRGGKRARKAKEAFAQTELRKLQNRMRFGEEEEEVGAYDETKGMGMVGASSGRVRAGMGESRSKAKMSKMNKNRLAALRGKGPSGTATSGLASSLVFTPVQGLELVDPSAQQKKIDEANSKWFADGAFSIVR
ncbi:Nop domain-containing protein [Atractiella rhizophila]|nr:Nop domain-containing protein [Atractiella rhizophila]